MNDISVIIPHRNDNDVLPNAIASIRSQNVACDIIIVDNASEQTPAIAGCITLKHQHDLGIAASLNDGYKWAITPYCCMLGADDTFNEGWLKVATAMLEANQQIEYVSPNTSALLSLPSIMENNYMHMGAMFRRSMVLGIGGYADVPFFDWDLWVRMAMKGIKGVSIANNFYNWNRDHPGTHNESEPRYSEYVAMLQERWGAMR